MRSSTAAAFLANGGAELEAELREALAPDIQLLRPLGAGAMGLVFVGRDPTLKRLVAIKVLSPSLAGDSSARERFVRESEASAAVNHPNVAGIYLVGELPRSGIPYYVMQYIEGRTLADELREAGMMSEPRVKRILGEVATALQAAHDKGVVHRDVKPANIMIESGTDRPIVLDFGISAVLTQETQPDTARITTAGTYIGTPVYMSPEQATHEPVTGKSDVYGLGLVAFEMLTGKPPFDGSPIVVMAAHVEKPPPDLRALRPGIDEHLVQVVEQCLRKSPVERPTASDVARSLLPSGRMQLEWPPPGLDLIRGRGARLTVRWLIVCVALLLFFVVLYARPTVESLFWRGVTTQGAIAIWLFLAAASALLVLFTSFSAMLRTAYLLHQLRVAHDDGYPWPVSFDAAWDDHADTALVKNGAGIYALWGSERRAALLRARRARAFAGLGTIALTLLMPALWLSGALRSSGDTTDILSGNDVLIMATPLLIGMLAIAVLDHLGRSAIMQREEGSRVHVELVRGWLASAGHEGSVKSPASRFVAGALALGNAALTLVIMYLVCTVLVVTFTTTTNLSNARQRAIPPGMCANTREVLFGGHPDLVQQEVLGRMTTPVLLKPLGWIGLGGLRDRMVICSAANGVF